MAVSKLDVNYTFLVYVWMIPDKSITQNSEQCLKFRRHEVICAINYICICDYLHT
jgi:hypothetical protein